MIDDAATVGDVGTDRAADVAVVGGGPAGLMAAERLALAGRRVHVFDAMPSVGRKFLLAGRGGLNLTHAEPFAAFVARYGARREVLEPMLREFGPEALCHWAQRLGIPTFVGSSGRVFPTDMKAAPLLRAWLHRLRAHGVELRMRHRWLGWDAAGALRFATPGGERRVAAPATVLALGGASWPRLGSTGAWVEPLRAAGVGVAPLVPSNCGFDVAWSDHLRRRYAGAALKGVAIRVGDDWHAAGEFVVTDGGIEGPLVYAASSRLRDAIARDGCATFELDLLPAHDAARIAGAIVDRRGARSLGSQLRARLKLDGVKAALLWECLARDGTRGDATQLAAAIKALPITVTAPRPLAEAISTAGGVRFDALDERLMLRARPGVFVAGEMLDWEAPTGGYLLTACFATGRRAGDAAAAWVRGRR